MRPRVQFYHTVLNIAWMQSNQSRKFLFAGICGCHRSTQGSGGIIVNTVPEGVCQFCNRDIEMAPLYALTSRGNKWLELYKTEEGQYATRTPDFAPGAESQSVAGSPAVCTSN